MPRPNPFKLILLFSFQHMLLCAQPLRMDVQMLNDLSTSQRHSYIHSLQLELLDSVNFISVYNQLSSFAEEKKDWMMLWDLHYYFFLQRVELKTTPQENIDLLTKLEKTASGQGFDVGKIIAQHYLFFEKYYNGQVPLGLLYTNILQETEQMREVGFENFIDYDIDRLLYHNAKLIYELDDLEKALQYFQLAEQYTRPTERNGQAYILVLNHLQSIYQKRGDFQKGIEYAKKILHFVQHPPAVDSAQLKFYHQWEGLSSIDIANMLVGQGKIAESKPYAQNGYELSRANDSNNRFAMRLEYDALQSLVPTKLGLGELKEAEPLLDRLDELHQAIGGEYENYFNNIEYFECRAQFHEMKGEFAEAMRYTKLAKPLQDSLDRRNDARHLEQLTQRLKVEKYTEKIRLVEQERELQKRLRDTAFVILALVLLLAFGWFHRQRYLRHQQKAELEAAKNGLAEMTQSFREKSAMAENLRLEMEKLARSGQHSKYLEELTNSTILTEDDWLHFRQGFEKAHPGFISEQLTQYPDLTPAELRHLILEKLQLSTHEMANMLGVSDSAVRKTRARVRKKMMS